MMESSTDRGFSVASGGWPLAACYGTAGPFMANIKKTWSKPLRSLDWRVYYAPRIDGEVC